MKNAELSQLRYASSTFLVLFQTGFGKTEIVLLLVRLNPARPVVRFL